jgi:hypothetical protein
MNVTSAKYKRPKEKAMPTFTIDAENNIVAHAALPAGSDQSQSFSSAKELAALIAEWPASRLVDIWNSFAGVAPFDDLEPVKKFASRKAAVARIWPAVARLSPDGAQPAPDVAPGKGKAKKAPAKAAGRAQAQKGATESRANKKAEVIAMMKRAKGVTLAEIVEATGWQKHTVRGFVSILGSKGGQRSRNFQRRFRFRPGAAFLALVSPFPARPRGCYRDPCSTGDTVCSNDKAGCGTDTGGVRDAQSGSRRRSRERLGTL